MYDNHLFFLQALLGEFGLYCLTREVHKRRWFEEDNGPAVVYFGAQCVLVFLEGTAVAMREFINNEEPGVMPGSFVLRPGVSEADNEALCHLLFGCFAFAGVVAADDFDFWAGVFSWFGA